MGIKFDNAGTGYTIVCLDNLIKTLQELEALNIDITDIVTMKDTLYKSNGSRDEFITGIKLYYEKPL